MDCAFRTLKRAALALVVVLPALAAGPITARQVIERIQKHVNCPWQSDTVDVFKAGNPDTPVTGIATTFIASMDVLQRAAASGKNLIITHEPTFYNHTENTKDLTGVSMLAVKRDFIEKHKLVVWRFHDHWHRNDPDGIITGMTQQFGWQKHRQPGWTPIYVVPETTLGDLASSLKKRLNVRAPRVIGDPKMKVTKVGFAPGASGSENMIRFLDNPGVEVLLAGEADEWKLAEYARDSYQAGKRKGVIFLGHVVSEEAGMQNCARWLKGFVPEVPVEFLPAGEPFWSPQ